MIGRQIEKPAMKGVIFEVTSRCNLRCQYCYNIHKGPLGIRPSHGGYRNAKRTLKQLFRSVDVERVTMTGGEPFLQERFLELVLLCRMKGKRVVIISNGTGGSADQYRSLVEMGVVLFELPLHSTVPSEHDAMTGVPGSHEKVLKSIATLKKLGALVVPMIVVTKINHTHVSDTLRLFRSMGLMRIMLNRFNIGGSGIQNADALALSNDALRGVFSVADTQAARFGLNVSSNVCSPACVVNGKDYPNIRFSRCSPEVSRRPLTLDIEGNIRFCNHSPVNMGNIFRNTFSHICSSDYAKSWQHRPAFCEGCEKWHKCYGGCRAASEQLGQTVAEVDPILQTDIESISHERASRLSG